VSRVERALPWALGVLAVAYRLAYPLVIGPADESYLLFGARRTLDGNVIYRDFFEVLTPLAFQFYAAVLAIGGRTLLAARVAAAIVDGIAGNRARWWSTACTLPNNDGVRQALEHDYELVDQVLVLRVYPRRRDPGAP
jgi:hypothetical protein